METTGGLSRHGRYHYRTRCQKNVQLAVEYFKEFPLDPYIIQYLSECNV